MTPPVRVRAVPHPLAFLLQFFLLAEHLQDGLAHYVSNPKPGAPPTTPRPSKLDESSREGWFCGLKCKLSATQE